MKTIFALAVVLLAVSGFAADPANQFPPQKPVPALSPAEELKQFQLPPGYHLELVLSEPDIKEPVIAAFDGNGRMFVAEMRSYMQDIDGRNELIPAGRVSLHWSSKGDGHYDRHTVFADKLILPRMLLPLADGVLIGETDTSDIYLYRDTNGDGISDEKTLWYAGGRRGGNLEHQPNGLLWAMDNWLYSTYNAYRLRGPGTNVVREPTGPNGGQWGITQDDFGKPWFIDAGGERGPMSFQVPIVYGSFRVKDEFSTDYMEVWPLVGLADVQGGPIRFRPENKTLNHFTATCGNVIFRGDRLPADLRGDLLFGEPVGRLIRRTKVDVKDGLTYLRNAYEKSEFIRSTDPNFRSVNMTTAPDGTLYIVDMYRGIIQEGNWVREDSYLRKVVQQYQLDKNFGMGRIWRLVHDNFKPGPQPRMNDEMPAQLVAHLEHPNGWWRDTAQKLLVMRGDKSVVPALQKMARSNANPLARLHALWTLEGLDMIDATLVRDAMKDTNPQVRVGAIRVSETLYKAGDKSVTGDIRALAKDSDPAVVMQSILTANLLKWPDARPFIEATIAGSSSVGVKEIGTQMIAPPRQETPEVQLTAGEKKLMDRGKAIYQELCFACHGPDGKGMKVDGAPAGTTLAPPLGGSKTVLGHRDGMINVVLHGLTGPVGGRKYDALMVPMASNDDEWIASVVSFIRNSFGNRASLVTPADVTKVRAGTANRTEPWTLEELHAVLPQPLKNKAQWKLTASHRKEAVGAAIDGNLTSRYDTGTSQVPGMWFQIELPQEVILTGIELNSTPSPRDYPRGYKVELSTDGNTWGQPVASGRGSGPVTDIIFNPAMAKFIRITQTGEVEGLFWSIHEMELYQPGTALPVTKTAKKPGVNYE